MERFNRAERRAQTVRLKAKRKTYWGYPQRFGTCGYPPHSPEGMSPRQLGMVSQTPHPCSCALGCGNARAFYGRTLKEIVHMIEEKEGIMLLR